MKKVLIILLFIIFSSTFSQANSNEKITVEDIENIFFSEDKKKINDNETWVDYFTRLKEQHILKKVEMKKKMEKIKQLEERRDNETWEMFFKRIKVENKEAYKKRKELRGIAKSNPPATIVRVVFSRSEKQQKRRPGDIFYALSALRSLISDWDKYAKIFWIEAGDKIVPGMRCEWVGGNINKPLCSAFKKSTYKKIEKFKKDPSNEKVLGRNLIKYIKNRRMLIRISERLGLDNWDQTRLIGDMLNATVKDIKKNNISPDLQIRRALLKKYSLILRGIKKKLDEDNYKSIDKNVSKLSKTYENLNSLTTTTNEMVKNIDEAVSILFDTNKLIQKSVLNSKDNEEEKLLALSSIYFMQTLIDSILNTIPEKYYVETKVIPMDLFTKSDLEELDIIINNMINKNKEIKSAELTKSMDIINNYINTSDMLKALDNLAIKNNINKEFTPNSVTKIAEQQIRDNLDREILKEAKKLLQEIDRNELSELTKEVSKVASEVASDPSVKQSGSILDKKFGNITVKQLIGACRSRGNC